jgi:iron(II)-dependent oxidoreductase
MASIAPVAIDRAALANWYRSNRVRTASLFALAAPNAFEKRPIELRHPIVFYEGHIPAFSASTLVRRALGGAPIDVELETLFERGIDPADERAAAQHVRSTWPSQERLARFARACDDAVLEAFASADLTHGSPMNERAQASFTILEHEAMHQETLSYILHRLPEEDRASDRCSMRTEGEPAARGRVEIPAGRATLGANRDEIPFGWDNEFTEHAIDVPRFEIDVNDVTNGDYLAFVREGGSVPPFWIERNGSFALRAMFGDIELPLSWPV